MLARPYPHLTRRAEWPTRQGTVRLPTPVHPTLEVAARKVWRMATYRGLRASYGIYATASDTLSQHAAAPSSGCIAQHWPMPHCCVLLEASSGRADVSAVSETDPLQRSRLASSVWVLALLLAGWAGAFAGAGGCSENLRPGTTREHVCTTFGLSHWVGVEWLVFASAPAVLLALGLIVVPQLRRPPQPYGWRGAWRADRA